MIANPKNYDRFLRSPLIMRVPMFLLVGFNYGTQKEKGQKGFRNLETRSRNLAHQPLQPQILEPEQTLNPVGR